MKLRTVLKAALLTGSMIAATGCKHDAAPATTTTTATPTGSQAPVAPVAPQTLDSVKSGISITWPDAPDDTVVSSTKRCGHLDKFGEKISTKIYDREKQKILDAHLSPEDEKAAKAKLKKQIESTKNWEGELTMEATVDGTIGGGSKESKIWAFSLPKGAEIGKGNLKDKMLKIVDQDATRVCIPYNQVAKHDETVQRTDYDAVNIIVSAPPPPKVIVKYVTSPDVKR